MAQIIREISVDVAKSNIFQAIVAKQNDSNSRFLKVTLTNEGTPLTIASSSTVTINALRDDGESNAFLGTVNADGTVTVPLSNWMLALDGMVKCDISVVDTDERKLTSTMFSLAVEEAAYDGSEISDDENYDLLVELLDNYTVAKNACETATTAANTAADNANAKASLADQKATLANTKANLADQKATLADEKALLADGKATLADEAATAATSATESANTATTNANTAKQNADTATAAANTAAANATTKANLADEKATLAQEKAVAANTAAESANTAASAAQTAKQNADTATANANTATAAANTATEQATSAASAANAAAELVTTPLVAGNIAYDNTDSGLTAINVKTAIDELTEKIGGVADIAFESWEDVQRIVRLGLAPKAFNIGDQFTVNKGDIPLVWDVIGFDHDTPTDANYTHSMTLQLHNCYNNFQFDAPEALYYCENELPAGNYYFTIHDYDVAYGGNKSYTFTLSNAVPVGGQICFGWGYSVQASTCTIETYASSSNTTAIETVNVSEGTTGTFLGTTNGLSDNMNHAHRIRYGSNRWGQSAIRLWLNSSSDANNWWSSTNIFDRPSANVSTAGFLNGIDADFLAVVGNVTKRTALNTVTDGGTYEDLSDKMFLISRGEVYGGNENNIDEGTPYPYYKDYSDLTGTGTGVDVNRIKYLSNTARYWWLRSPASSYAYGVRFVHTTGSVSNYGADNSIGVAPACCII